MKSIIQLLIIILITILNCTAQETTTNFKLRKNTISLELLGNSVAPLSLSYDRVIYNQNNIAISSTLNASRFTYQTSTNQSETYYALSNQLNLIFGKNCGHTEIGLGLAYTNNKFGYSINNSNYIDAYRRTILTGRIGYRYQNPKNGFYFRAAFTPNLVLKCSYKDRLPCNPYNYGWLDLRDLDLGLYFIGVSVGYSF